MNPYASQLGSEDPVHVLAASPAKLEGLAARLAARVELPIAPGKWSPRQIMIHLADCELAFGFRYRQALGEDDHLAQPFDQDQWAKSYAAYDAQQALRTFATLRQWNLALIRSLSPEQMTKRLRHPERGEMAFRELIETAAGHDLNHLSQLEAVATQAA